MTGRLRSWMVVLFLLGTMAYCIAEELTLTTYYPSPRGVYQELRTAGNVQIGSVNAPAVAADAPRLYVIQDTSVTSIAPVLRLDTRDPQGTITQRLVINKDGNVGIGTTSPAALLDVNAILQVRQAGGGPGKGGVGIGVFPTGATLQVQGDPSWAGAAIYASGAPYGASLWGTTNGILTGSCSGCSVLAELVPISGAVTEGEAVCMGDDGENRRCAKDADPAVTGIMTYRTEMVFRQGCGSDSNNIGIGGATHYDPAKAIPGCKGWYPIALKGLAEGTKVVCTRPDGSLLHTGDRLVSSLEPGYLRPLAAKELGGDAVVGSAHTTCTAGKTHDLIDVWVK